MAKKKILINDVSVRDGNQSLMATRMPLNNIVDLVKKLDLVGFNALEVWGGATFDVCLRFLNEDPWERLREIKKVAKNTPLSMLVRGKNLVGYTHYADDIITKFIAKALENGIDIIRVFDALNDLANIEATVKATKRFGGHCQCAIAYTVSPVHSIAYFVKLAESVTALGADSICIKDMAGILLPEVASELIRQIKQVCSLPICLHSHATAGISALTMQSSISAGVDIVEGCCAPFSQGASHTSVETIVTIAKELGYEVNLNLEKLNEATDLATTFVNNYIDNNLISAKAFQINPRILEYQVPGGMISNLMSQLKRQKASNRYEDVLKEVPNVRKDLGFPPLVTPLSQMVGTQAVMNVLSGERYKIISNEVREYVVGNYGKPPGIISETLKENILNSNRSNATISKALSFAETKQALINKGYVKITDEQILSYILFPQYALKLLNDKTSEVRSENTERKAFNIYFKE